MRFLKHTLMSGRAETLPEGEEKYREFLANLGDVAYETDDQGNITYANKMAEVVTGLPLSEIIGRAFLPLFDEASKEKAIDKYRRTLRGESLEFELTFVNGKTLRFKNEPRRDKTGKIIGVFGIAHDITERKRAEEGLRRAHDELEDRVRERTQRLHTVNKNLFKEIRERRQAEEAVRASEERWRSLVENAPNFITIVDRDYKIQFVNRTLPGMVREEVIGHCISDFIDPAYHDLARATIERVFTSGKPGAYISTGIGRHGQSFWYDNQLGPLVYDGRVVAVMLITTDITESKKAEEALRQAYDELEDRVRERTAELSTANAFLIEEVDERKRAEDALQRAHDELESRVGERTAQLSQVNERLRREIAGRKQVEKSLLEDRERLRALTLELSLTEERERRQFAADLHDSIGQNLAMAKMELRLLQESVAANDQARSIVMEIDKMIEQASEITRSLMFDLSPSALYRFGYEAAVGDLADRIWERYGIQVDFKDDGHNKPLPPDLRVVLYRATRELLINVVKHAQTQNAKVTIRKNKGDVRIEVSDKGVGFDTREISPGHDGNGRFGLFNIRERLSYLGGRLEVKSKLGCGTRITLTAPYEGVQDISKEDA